VAKNGQLNSVSSQLILGERVEERKSKGVEEYSTDIDMLIVDDIQSLFAAREGMAPSGSAKLTTFSANCCAVLSAKMRRRKFDIPLPNRVNP